MKHIKHILIILIAVISINSHAATISLIGSNNTVIVAGKVVLTDSTLNIMFEIGEDVLTMHEYVILNTDTSRNIFTEYKMLRINNTNPNNIDGSIIYARTIDNSMNIYLTGNGISDYADIVVQGYTDNRSSVKKNINTIDITTDSNIPTWIWLSISIVIVILATIIITAYLIIHKRIPRL